jgi:hypothetical protein
MGSRFSFLARLIFPWGVTVETHAALHGMPVLPVSANDAVDALASSGIVDWSEKIYPDNRDTFR